MLSGKIAPEDVIAALRVPENQRTDAQRERLRGHHIETAPELVELRAGIAGLEQQRRTLEESLPLTMYSRAMDAPRVVRILPRGNWLDETGEIVQPAIPAFLGALETDGRATRLDLARWLVTPQDEGGVGELTARVFVNRVWALLFGEGLCPSLDDFGGQGRPPNHLELLDHLALDFIDSGWDVKGLIKKLVMTRTYRQSSIPDAAARERDPENHLFARQSRTRLPAEMVRDTALAVSGLLVDDIGGPSVKPRQPSGLYRHLNFPKRKYERDMGREQYRRGVYMHWQRQFLHPMLSAFDAPTREECTAQRAVSNTPLAALTLLNDPVFVEASRQFAERVLRDGPGDDRARIAFAMREATGRVPDQGEAAVLESLLSGNLEYYEMNDGEAESLITVGDSPRDESIDAGTLAAWTQVCRAILNLHETMTRE